MCYLYKRWRHDCRSDSLLTRRMCMRTKNKMKISKNLITHTSAAVLGLLIALISISVADERKFKSQQNSAIYTTDNHGDGAPLNRDIFNSANFESIEWQYQTNQRVGEILGKTAAKEYAMDMDSLKSGAKTSQEMFGDRNDYCASAVVRAYNDAVSRLRFNRKNIRAVPFPLNKRDTTEDFEYAVSKAKRLCKHFENDSISNFVIKNPSESEMQNVSTGSIIRRGRHCYMYMGVGFIDRDGKTFVPDSRGRMVIASDDTDCIFEYMDMSRFTVIDVPKIVEFKLQTNVRRHVR